MSSLGLADHEADPLPLLGCLPSLVCDLDAARHRVDAAYVEPEPLGQRHRVPPFAAADVQGSADPCTGR
jgi:hypothetical protein